MKPKERGPMPLMKSLDDAVAVCAKEKDNFYLTAFVIEAWLGEATMRTVAEYAEKKDAKDRRMQNGEVNRLFQEGFGHTTDKDFSHLYGALLRFMEYDDPQSRIMFDAFYAMGLEYPVDTFPTLELPLSREKMAEGIRFIRQQTARLCDWLDAVVHWQVHEHYHLSPVSFNPDPEKRELAVLGVNQRCFATLSERSKQWWQWHHGEAAERFKDSPKWPTVGKAMADSQTKVWNHPALDQGIIMFWPLLKRHNWSYRDLLNVLRMVMPQPDSYPCHDEKEFSTYCVNVLGLRKEGQGRTSPDGRPTGWEVALRLCGKKP